MTKTHFLEVPKIRQNVLDHLALLSYFVVITVYHEQDNTPSVLSAVETASVPMYQHQTSTFHQALFVLTEALLHG